MRILAVGSAAVLLLTVPACFGGNDPNLTTSGKGRPTVEVTFPDTVEPGSVHDAVIEVTNPGPGAIRIVAVSFALVAPVAGETEFPTGLVAPGARRESRSVLSVSPEPTGISEDATVYTFGPTEGDEPRLPVGESIEIVFSLRVPEDPGPAANSVQAYDGNEIDRAGGARLATDVRR